ncbi:hypothetical protein ACLB2K_049754 [Fragaria x ananassa]
MVGRLRRPFVMDGVSTLIENRKRRKWRSDGVVGSPVETRFPVQDSTWAKVHALTPWALVQFWPSSRPIVDWAWGGAWLAWSNRCNLLVVGRNLVSLGLLYGGNIVGKL